MLISPDLIFTYQIEYTTYLQCIEEIPYAWEQSQTSLIPDRIKINGKYLQTEKKCECGCDSVGLFKHSTWCPKFDKGV